MEISDYYVSEAREKINDFLIELFSTNILFPLKTVMQQVNAVVAEY